MPQSVTPAEVHLSAAGGQSLHLINNNSDQRMMFKVKISNTDDYRVSPAFGFVDASGQAQVEVTRR
ncbi:unnamed protein product, partial [Heligmosomoides polygyrus]|uniref:MSP domain-containing protein n=1 Tax=Heligmosomoides polygyrus TaxID=6339 RepID=A0A183FC37_HELPZ